MRTCLGTIQCLISCLHIIIKYRICRIGRLVQWQVRYQDQWSWSRLARIGGPKHGAQDPEGISQHPHSRQGHSGRGHLVRGRCHSADGRSGDGRPPRGTGADGELRPNAPAFHADPVGRYADWEATSGTEAGCGGSFGSVGWCHRGGNCVHFGHRAEENGGRGISLVVS